MKIIRLFTLLGAVMFASFVSQNAFAQSAGDSGAPPAVNKGAIKPVRNSVELRIDRWSKQLDLTAEQQIAIRSILEGEAIKLQAIRKDSGQNIAEHKVKLQEIREDTFKKINSILTPEQQIKYDAQRKALKELRQRRTSSGPGSSGVESSR